MTLGLGYKIMSVTVNVYSIIIAVTQLLNAGGIQLGLLLLVIFLMCAVVCVPCCLCICCYDEDDDLDTMLGKLVLLCDMLLVR